jgi:glyoxylase-like metal-dependent hydrolase (beta-lactamase superfamily II)
MSDHRSRREVLKSGVAAASLLSAFGLPGVAVAARAAALRLEPLTDRLSLVTGGACNVVVLRGEQGLLLVDGGAGADAHALLRLLEERFPRLPVKALLNTHWHLAHTGLNAEVRRRGGEVIAHENTRLWMTTVINSRWEDRVYPPQPEGTRPSRTFYDGVQSLDFEGQRVEYALLPQAHTDGDIYVRFPTEDVIATGDVVAPGRYPIVDSASNGWLGGMVFGLRALAALGHAATRFVPGSGPVARLPELKAQEELCATVAARIGDSYFRGETWEQLQAAQPTREFDATRGDPALFLRQSYESAWYHVNEIRRVARPGA